jgi:HEAT repeat protein
MTLEKEHMNTSNSYTLTGAEQLRMDASKQFALNGEMGIHRLIEMLGDPSWVVRREVVETLAGMGTEAIEALCNELKNNRSSEARIAATVDALSASKGTAEIAVALLAEDEDPAVVADVAQILGRRKNRVSIPVLIKLIKHSNDNVAVGAIEGLGRIGGKTAIEALIDSIGSGNFFRTFPAIDVLGRSGDPRVVEPLTKLLKNASYLPEAARALGLSGERSAVKPLIELLHSPSNVVVRVAATSISELRSRFEEKSGGEVRAIEEELRERVSIDIVRRLARMLPEMNASESITISKFLGIIGNAEAVPELTAQLDGTPAMAESAADALKKIGNAADLHLRQAIREGQSSRRKILLPLVTRTAAANDVALCLSDEDSEVRALACDTLARLGVTTVVPEIFKLLSDSNLRVVHSATAAIQALGTRETRVLAVAASQSPLPGVRRSALNILAYFGDSSATLPMLNGLKDSDNRVREAALQGLPFLEDLSAQEALYEYAKDPNVRMRSLAMRSIGLLPKSTERAFSVLLKGITDGDAWVRYYSCQSLGRLGFTSAAVEISRLLSDEAGQVRVSAVEALSNLDSAEAHKALRFAVESNDPDVKRAALVGLGIAKREEDLPVILSEINSVDAPTRLIALSALVNFPSLKVFSALNSAGSDSDEQVRSAAIGFLAARPEEEATKMLIEFLKRENTYDKAKAGLLIPSTGRVPGILAALESADDEVASILMSILSRLGQGNSFIGLLLAMKLNNAAARKAAAASIAVHTSRPEMMAVLKEAADNDPDREVRQICKVLLNE